HFPFSLQIPPPTQISTLSLHDALPISRLDARRAADLRRRMQRHDAVMNALPYYFNYPVAKTAVGAGLHYADLGGNTEIVQKQRRSEEHTSELQSRSDLVCRLLLEKKKR